MFRNAKVFFRQIANKVFDLDDTVKPKEHMKLFEDYLDKFEFNTNTADVSEFLEVLRKKHLVDDIVVSTPNGSAIASTNGDSISTAISGAALFSYVQSEHPKSESILIKAGMGWNIIFPYSSKLYILRASSDLSIIELRALAREIDAFLGKNKRK